MKKMLQMLMLLAVSSSFLHARTKTNEQLAAALEKVPEIYEFNDTSMMGNLFGDGKALDGSNFRRVMMQLEDDCEKRIKSKGLSKKNLQKKVEQLVDELMRGSSYQDVFAKDETMQSGWILLDPQLILDILLKKGYITQDGRVKGSEYPQLAELLSVKDGMLVINVDTQIIGQANAKLEPLFTKFIEDLKAKSSKAGEENQLEALKKLKTIMIGEIDVASIDYNADGRTATQFKEFLMQQRKQVDGQKEVYEKYKNYESSFKPLIDEMYKKIDDELKGILPKYLNRENAEFVIDLLLNSKEEDFTKVQELTTERIVEWYNTTDDILLDVMRKKLIHQNEFIDDYDEAKALQHFLQIEKTQESWFGSLFADVKHQFTKDLIVAKHNGLYEKLVAPIIQSQISSLEQMLAKVTPNLDPEMLQAQENALKVFKDTATKYQFIERGGEKGKKLEELINNIERNIEYLRKKP